MAAPGTSPLADLREAYALLCAQIREVAVNPQPSYSEKGRSVSHSEHLAGLVARAEELAKIPGVAPDQAPVYQAGYVAR
jgi:hypothetical protein